MQLTDILSKRFCVNEIDIFGSYARGTATPESDIDFFVVCDKKNLDNMTGLWIYLVEIFDKNIEIINV